MRTDEPRRLIRNGTLAALAGAFAISQYPVHCTVLRLALLGCAAGAWIGVTILIWNRKALKRLALALPMLAAIPFMLPGDEMNADELRHDYVRRMALLEGTTYVWGGESPHGIDCSGLPRRALRDALLAYGVKHLNGRAFRTYAEHWWYDASAKALGEGFRSFTVPVGTAGTIRDMNHETLMPGDLAVTSFGVHVLAYAGEGLWIQADPNIGSVAILHGSANNGWFSAPVTVHRWSILMP